MRTMSRSRCAVFAMAGILSVCACNKVSGPSDNVDSTHGRMVVLISSSASGTSVLPKVVVRGPGSAVVLNASDTLDSLVPGTYRMIAYPVFSAASAGKLTGAATGDTAPLREFALGAGQTITASVVYAELPASGKMWVGNQFGGSLLAFRQEDLAVPGSPASAVKITIPYHNMKGMAFDSLGYCIVAAFDKNKLFIFSPGQLSGNGSARPKVTVNHSAISSPNGVAFDSNGVCWITNWSGGTIVGYTSAALFDLIASGDTISSRAPDRTITISNFSKPEYLCFDARNNLWTAGDTGSKSVIIRIDAADLAASGEKTPSIVLVESSAESFIGAEGLAFDKNGNLWGTDVRNFFKLEAAQIAQSGRPLPTVSRSLSLPGGLAFDAAGALWIPDAEHTIYRYVPGSAGNAVAFNTGADLNYPNAPVFFPKPF